jgi:hypothetical protein
MSSRGYLQQLAQPIAPGQTVLTARPGAAAFATEAGPVVPVIEDHFQMPARTVSAPDASQGRVNWPGINQHSVGQTIEAVERAVGEDATARARPADARHQTPQPPAVSANADIRASDSPAAASRKTSAGAPREASFIAQPLPAVASRMVADRREPAQARTPDSPGAEESIAQAPAESPLRTKANSHAEQVVQDKKAAKDALPSQSARQDYPTERTAIERATEAAFAMKAPQQKEKPDVQSQVAAGPRVHIGTVEIRMKLPQPPAPPAAPISSLAQNNAAMHGRGRSGSAEPLARGLEWSYGLVQG